jgi:TctA family transporter
MADVQVDIWGVFFQSLGQVVEGGTLVWMLVGMAVGFWVGILPGLGGGTALALMLPFVFTMQPITAFAFLLGMHSVTATTGDITSVLFGVPGEGTSAATVFDGYPLTKQGQASRALGIVLFSSLIGAIFGAFALALMVPIIRPVVMSFGPPELFMLAVLGLSFIIGLSGRSVAKGLLMAGVGLLLSTVGQDVGTARLRFTFGEPYLFDGISLVPVAVGLFAVPSLLEMMVLKASVSRVSLDQVNVRDSFRGIRDTFEHWWLVLRATFIGIACGVVPGIGGGVSQFVAYAHAQQTSKHRELFGKGSIEGLLAAGAVNNAKEGASLMPTVAFGIPGSSSMAILLGAFIITGLTPGPKMLTEHLDVTFGMVWTIVVANIICVAVCFILLKQLALLTFVRGSILVPFLLFLVAMGAYTANNQWLDIVLMLIFGAVGVAAQQWGWPVPPLLLGLVLGKTLETNFYLADQLFGSAWLTRPIVMVLLVLVAIALSWPLLIRRLERRSTVAQELAVAWEEA